jgi:alkylation response protein AidB-like acyl-CoA dehydrogenase
VLGQPGWRADYWKAFAEELGILGASFSEELGGLGGGAIDNMIIMEELGKALVVEPYLGTVVIGGGFMKHSGYAGAASADRRSSSAGPPPSPSPMPSRRAATPGRT